MAKSALLSVVLAGLVFAGCGTEVAGGRDPGELRIRGDDQVGGDVVSTVDGHPITIADVTQALAGLDPVDAVEPALALERLQDEAVLAQAAARAGWGDAAEVDHAAKQALVQALLARTIDPMEVTIEDADVEAVYEEGENRFNAPEQRASVYVLARVGAEDEAVVQPWLAEIVAELSNAPDAAASALAVRRRQLDHLPFEVEVLEVGGMTRDSPSAPVSYREALFGLETLGVVPAPVRTELGWHVVVLTHIEPARTMGRVEALLTLREERAANLRAQALGRLVAEIVSEHPVVVAPQAGALLANPRLLGAP